MTVLSEQTAKSIISRIAQSKNTVRFVDCRAVSMDVDAQTGQRWKQFDPCPAMFVRVVHGKWERK